MKKVLKGILTIIVAMICLIALIEGYLLLAGEPIIPLAECIIACGKTLVLSFGIGLAFCLIWGLICWTDKED